MKRALLKWLLRLLATMAALVVLVAASVAVVMNTERGTRWALERATHAVPGELLVGEFRGTLWRGLRFDELVYSSDGQRFTATDLEVKVSWAASALGYLRFTHVNATSLVIELEASDGEPAATLAVPPTPVTLSVRASAIGELRLAGGDRETVIRDIRLRTVRYEDSTVSLDTLRLELEGIALRATDASLGLTGNGPLRAGVEWRLIDDDWSGSGPLRGSLATIEFEQTVIGDLPAFVSGRVHLLGRREPLFDLRLEWSDWSFDNFDLVNGEVSVAGLVDDFEIATANAVLVNDGRRVPLTLTGRGDRQGLGDASRLDQQVFETPFARETPHLGQQIVPERAADAAVRHLHQRLVGAGKLGVGAHQILSLIHI